MSRPQHFVNSLVDSRRSVGVETQIGIHRCDGNVLCSSASKEVFSETHQFIIWILSLSRKAKSNWG